MSGTGKTTLLKELARRGLRTVDTDDEGWTLADGTWDATRMAALLDRYPDVIVSGTVDNQVDFYARFGHVVLLSVPLATALHRVSTRANNPYGRTAGERNEIARYTAEVEPLLRESATVELDGRLPVSELADRVGALAR
ncbi:AAA family ATPase [Mycobacterium sp. CBMA271]|nr:AAA family ATPase [Mycobacteroides sp. CBMA 271]